MSFQTFSFGHAGPGSCFYSRRSVTRETFTDASGVDASNNNLVIGKSQQFHGNDGELYKATIECSAPPKTDASGNSNIVSSKEEMILISDAKTSSLPSSWALNMRDQTLLCTGKYEKVKTFSEFNTLFTNYRKYT